MTPVPDTLSEYQFAGLLRAANRTGEMPGFRPAGAGFAEIVLRASSPGETALSKAPTATTPATTTNRPSFGVPPSSALPAARTPIYHSTYTGKPPDEPAVLGVALNEVFVPCCRSSIRRSSISTCRRRAARTGWPSSYQEAVSRPRQAGVMFGIWSFLRQFMYTKTIIVVDDDVDIRDWKEVVWALTTRSTCRDTTLVDNTPSTTSISPPVAGLGSKMGLDATNKWPGKPAASGAGPLSWTRGERRWIGMGRNSASGTNNGNCGAAVDPAAAPFAVDPAAVGCRAAGRQPDAPAAPRSKVGSRTPQPLRRRGRGGWPTCRGAPLPQHRVDAGLQGAGEPGLALLAENLARKLAWTWEISRPGPACWSGCIPAVPTGLVEEAIIRRVPELAGTAAFGGRSDTVARTAASTCLRRRRPAPCYVEVKNVTAAVADGVGLFPDAVTERGAKHLREMMAVVAGAAAPPWFLRPAGRRRRGPPGRRHRPGLWPHAAPGQGGGVAVLALGAVVTPGEIVLDRPLPVVCP